MACPPLLYASARPLSPWLAGYSQASVVGRAHSFLAGPDSDPVVLADIDAALGEERPITAELLVYRRDGAPFWSQVGLVGAGEGGAGGPRGAAHALVALLAMRWWRESSSCTELTKRVRLLLG